VYYVLPFSSGGKVNKDPVYGLHLVSAMPATHMRGYENDIVFINAGNGAWATGWIDSGKIITCDHVVQGRKGPFTIQFVYEKNGRYHLGRKHRVGVLVTDYKRDEAALVPVNPDLFSRLHGFPLPTTTPPRIGEKVFAVGFPGRKLTLMEGTFLGPGKPTILEGFGRNNHPYHIQMTVHPGASGSPVFNLDGQIFGMVEGYEQDDPGVSIDIQGKYFDRVAVKTYAVTGRGTQFIRGKASWTTTYGG
jgi:S1-C subfamily serine protease